MLEAMGGLGLIALAALGGTEAAVLAGPWNYQVGDRQGPLDADASGPHMAVPSNWYTQGLDTSGVVWFSRRVKLPAHRKAVRNWRLNFEGVDYAATVYWDGRAVGQHTGYFGAFSVDLGPVAAGEYRLAVRVDSPLEVPADFSRTKRLIKGVLSHHDTRPGGAWSTRGQEANTGGIWGTVTLEPCEDFAADSVRVDTLVATPARAELRLKARLTLWGHSTPIQIRVYDPNGRLVHNAERLVHGSGARSFALQWPVAHPALWWPRDLGEQPLYRIELSAGGDRYAVTFGIRTVARDARGEIRINGRPIFLRGTNYIGSLYLAALDQRKLETDFDLITAAHINAIRIHAHVAPQRLYDLADRLGLLIWQDFPLQWGYADTPEFEADALRQLDELVDQFGRHPSIAYWNAHNEAPWSSDWMIWKYPDYEPDQNRRLDRALADRLETVDPRRPSQGNSHPAEHAWFGWYHSSYRDFQKPCPQSIMTEFGAQAVPALSTLKTFFQPAQLWPLEGENLALWQYHNFQRHELTEIAKVPLGDSVDELIANTQSYQARLLQFGVEAFRLQKWQPVAGIFQFMFVEHWASISWGIVDYLRRPKTGYYALARAYQPILPIAAARGQPPRLDLYAINDRPRTYRGVVLSYAIAEGPEQPLTVDLVLEADERSALLGHLPLPNGRLQLWLRDAGGTLLGINDYEPRYFQGG